MFSFDANTVAPASNNFEPIPAGVYPAVITDAKLGALKSGNGTGLSLTYSILEGPFANRKVFSNLNVQHNNPTAQQIGQEALSSICRATGAMKLDGNSLHLICNKPLKIKVKIRKDEQYGDKNEVSAVEAMQGAAAPAAAPRQAAPAAQPAAAGFGGGNPPWAAAR